MEAIALVVFMVIVGIAAQFWGVDSREGFGSSRRPPRWFIIPVDAEAETRAAPPAPTRGARAPVRTWATTPATRAVERPHGQYHARRWRSNPTSSS